MKYREGTMQECLLQLLTPLWQQPSETQLPVSRLHAQDVPLQLNISVVLLWYTSKSVCDPVLTKIVASYSAFTAQHLKPERVCGGKKKIQFPFLYAKWSHFKRSIFSAVFFLSSELHSCKKNVQN